MKKFMVLVGLMLVMQWAVATEGIQFEHGTLKEAYAKATKEHKLIFVDCYTVWCGPCRWMAENVFTDATVASFFNTHFVNVKLDMEKGEGPKMSDKWAIQGYPTLQFLNAKGEVMHSALGGLPADKFLELGKEIADPAFVSLPAMTARYDGGERDRVFLKDYILRLFKSGQDFAAPLGDFSKGMEGAALLEQDNWDIFEPVFQRYEAPQVTYFLANRTAFEEKFGQEQVQRKAFQLYHAGLTVALQDEDEAAYKNIRDAASKSGVKDLAFLLSTLDVDWYQAQGDWKNYAAAADILVKNDKELDANMLNNFAWTIFENASDDNTLNMALGWATQSVEMQPAYANMDTKAMLLMKLGRRAEAITTAKAAIEIAKETGADYSATAEALKEMEKR
jgi:thiol-disulfide isomerase/thioredoxin